MPKQKVVARTGDLRDGQMKLVDVAGTPVLLTRLDGTYHAIGGHCTHYDAPLDQGVLCGHRVICPWHHACFDVRTGDHLEPPGLDALPRYEVALQGDEVVISVPDETPARRVPDMVAPDTRADGRTFAVLGGGAAGAAAVEVLRQVGFQGRVVLVTAEDRVNYDRTRLSKGFLAEDLHDLPGEREASFYLAHGIEVLTGCTAHRVDAGGHRVELSDGQSLAYDALLVATGGEPRRLEVPGAELPQVLTLRAPRDAAAINAAARQGRRAVVVGTSFVGMECAASLRGRDLDVTVVGPDPVPFARTLGEQVGRLFQRLHEDKGVRFVLGSRVERLEGHDRVEQVVLASGQRLPADFVVVGVGVRPRTGFLEGVHRNEDGGVNVDDRFRVEGADGSLYAAGDIAAFAHPLTGERVRVEHWRVARQHGWAAARSMASVDGGARQIPFFWTRQFGQNLRYVGHARTWDEVLIDGDLDGLSFLAYYVHHGQVVAVAGMGRDQAIDAVEECMRLQRMPALDQVRRGGVDWLGLLKGKGVASAQGMATR
ncbi:MAG: FAD-dependent oxidoreductase [Candidatus Latescibacterota bacterium]